MKITPPPPPPAPSPFGATPAKSPQPASDLSGVARQGFEWCVNLWRSTASLLHSGLSLRLAVQAMLLTLVSYGAINTWLLWSVERTYRGATLEWLAEGPMEERLERVCEQAKAKRSLKSHPLLQTVFQNDAPASEQYASLIEAIASDPSTAAARQAQLRAWITGDIHGSRFLVLSAEPVSGAELLLRIERGDPAWKHKLDGQKEQAVDLREFLTGFGDLVIQEVRPSVRNLQRINGWIQWATIFATWLVLLAAAHRARLLMRLNAQGWFVPTPDSGVASGAAGDAAAQEIAGSDEGARGVIPPLYDGAAQAAEFMENRHLPDLLDRQVYGPLSFLLGLLPSLGFIGTVYGMGDALLSADGLFQAQDKSVAISRITTHLGFAFDTTLVALLAGILASAVVVRLRVWENQLWHVAEQTQKE